MCWYKVTTNTCSVRTCKKVTTKWSLEYNCGGCDFAKFKDERPDFCWRIPANYKPLQGATFRKCQECITSRRKPYEREYEARRRVEERQATSVESANSHLHVSDPPVGSVTSTEVNSGPSYSQTSQQDATPSYVSSFDQYPQFDDSFVENQYAEERCGFFDDILGEWNYQSRDPDGSWTWKTRPQA